MVDEPSPESRDRSLTPGMALAEHKEHKGVWKELCETLARVGSASGAARPTPVAMFSTPMPVAPRTLLAVLDAP
eukprot:422976-Lingulodinium_polyedra.AAC.1